jgi:hypothetical protein
VPAHRGDRVLAADHRAGEQILGLGVVAQAIEVDMTLAITRDSQFNAGPKQ